MRATLHCITHGTFGLFFELFALHKVCQAIVHSGENSDIRPTVFSKQHRRARGNKAESRGEVRNAGTRSSARRLKAKHFKSLTCSKREWRRQGSTDAVGTRP